MSNHPSFSRRLFLKMSALATGTFVAAREFSLPRPSFAAQPAPAWQLQGDYFEACSCDYLCPCDTSDTAKPSRGYCKVALVFHIDQGRFGPTIMDDLNFIIVIDSPDVMSKGNWSLGIITDARANPDQAAALSAIASGKAGGPMAGVGPAVGKFVGTLSKPIQFHQDGMSRTVMVPGTLDQAIDGVPGADPKMPLYLDNEAHPANTRLALAQASHRHIDFFDIKDDTTVKTNGHYAPFSWQAA